MLQRVWVLNVVERTLTCNDDCVLLLFSVTAVHSSVRGLTSSPSPFHVLLRSVCSWMPLADSRQVDEPHLPARSHTHRHCAAPTP